jgi:hypothetical protein
LKAIFLDYLVTDGFWGLRDAHMAFSAQHMRQMMQTKKVRRATA